MKKVIAGEFNYFYSDSEQCKVGMYILVSVIKDFQPIAYNYYKLAPAINDDYVPAVD